MALNTKDQARFSPSAGADTGRTSHADARRLALVGQSARTWRARLLGAAPALALGALIALVWVVVTSVGLVATYFVPTPASVVGAFWHGMTTGLLPTYALTTLAESLAGFALGTIIAVPIGYGIARSPLLARALQPYLAASQAMPAVALAPLLALWLPYGFLPVVVLCALIVFFPTVVTTALGLRLLDPDVVNAARVEGAGRWNLMRHIELPLAAPAILAGLRTSLTLSITGAVVGEFVVGFQGLGGLLNIARSQFDSPLVFATLFTLGLLAALYYGIARVAERLFSYLEA